MGFDGALAQSKLLRHLTIAFAQRDQNGDFALPGGQIVKGSLDGGWCEELRQIAQRSTIKTRTQRLGEFRGKAIMQSSKGYETKKEAVKKKNDTYNTKLSEIDGLLNEVQAEEAVLDELSTRMLAAVGVKYGKDSDEYEQAGGTRTSDRKSPARKTAAAVK